MAKEKTTGNKVRRGGIIALEIFVIILAFAVIAVPLLLPIFRYSLGGGEFASLTIYDIIISGSVFNTINPDLRSEAYLNFNNGLMKLMNAEFSSVMGPIFYNVIAFSFIIAMIFAVMSLVAAIVGLATRKAKGSYYFATVGMSVPFLFMYLTPIIYSLVQLISRRPAGIEMSIGVSLPIIIIAVLILLDMTIVIIYRDVAHKQLKSITEREHIDELLNDYEERVENNDPSVEPMKDVEEGHENEDTTPLEEVQEEKPAEEESETNEEEKLAEEEKPVEETKPGEEEKIDDGFEEEPEDDKVIISPDTIMKANNKPVVKKVIVKKIIKKPVEKVDDTLPPVMEKPVVIFRNENLELKRLPKKVSEIGDSKYENNAKLQLADIPSGIKELGKSCFANCGALQELEIPSSVTKIANKAFYKCVNLKVIRYEGTREEFRLIERGPGWLAGCGTKIVSCSDGVISVNPYK